ncbi:embryonic growth/differentiation factor 1 [Pogona vitticeps]
MALLSLLVALQLACGASLAGAPDHQPGPETRLLQAMGLSPRPSPKSASPAPVPPLLWRLFRRGSAPGPEPCWVEEFQVPGNIIRVFRDQGGWIPISEPQGCLCLQKRLYFNVSALDAAERLTLAQLEIKFGLNAYGTSPPAGPFELSLYRASRLALRGMAAHAYGRQLVAARSFIHLHQALTFDLTGVAEEWRASAGNLGLILEIGAPAGPLCTGLDAAFEASLLVVSLAPAPCRGGRPRRGAPRGPAPAGSHVCKPRRLYLSFADVGWENWIIAPQGYLANYCLGECPFPLTEELNSTNHAILQTIVHSLDPEGTPQPCCVPVRLSPISILYYDNDDNVVLRHYEDMVVDECGCR